MDGRKLYQLVMPVAGIIYVIVMFLLDWNSKAVVVGALLLGLLAVVGSWLNRQEGSAEPGPTDLPPTSRGPQDS